MYEIREGDRPRVNCSWIFHEIPDASSCPQKLIITCFSSLAFLYTISLYTIDSSLRGHTGTGSGDGIGNSQGLLRPE